MGANRNLGNQSHYNESPAATGVNPHVAPGAVATAVFNVMPGFSRMRASIFQDQAGSLTITQANDPHVDANGFLDRGRVASTTAVTASTLAQTADVLIFKKYAQVKITNSSGTDTTICELDVILSV